MQTLSLAFLLFAPAQTPEIVDKVNAQLYILRLQDKETGAFKVTPDGKPSLRACNGAVKGLKYLGRKEPVPDVEKVKTFVLSCYDPMTGAFAEPGCNPDVTITSIGIMVACELGIPKEKFAKAVDYLRANANSFDEVRIGAAALEALGEKPEWLKTWYKLADDQLNNENGTAGEQDSVGRDTASVMAIRLRLGGSLADFKNGKNLVAILQNGQWKDGGFGKHGAEKSDFESTYRVMRVFMLLKEKPKNRRAIIKYLAYSKNADGGFGVAPGEPSTMSGTYYFAAISKWLE